MSELVRFLSGDNDVAQKTQMDPQNPTAKFVPLEPGQVLFGLEVVEDGSLLGTIYYDYKDKNGIITRVSMGNGGAGGSGGGGGIIRTLATTDGKHESDETTAKANVVIPLPKKIFANLLSAKTQFNFPKVHDPSNTAYVNEDAAPGQSYLYGNGLHMVNPFNTLQDSWIRTIGKSGSAEATLELAMRDNASNEYIYDQIVARHYKADGTIVTDTDGHKREVVILGKEGESQFPGPVTSQRGFVGDVDGNAKSATKAKHDWYDQVIDSTYLSKIVKTTHDGSKFEITSYDGRYTPVGSADAKKDVITIPGATTTLAGLVTTGDQTITGNKTINSSGTLTIMKQGGFIYSGIQEDKATDKNLPIWFSTGTANGTPNYSTELTYNPSTGTVTAKKFAGPATSATYDAEGGAIHDKYLKRAGGTMTGALNFADNTYNAFGDDIEIGSKNAVGKLSIHGKNGATGIVFVPYSGSTSQTISIDGAGVMTITGTVKTTLDGNASTATTLKTARNFNITDSSAAYSGPNVSFNGSANVTLHMPDTFAGTLKGNADTATKAAQDANGKVISTEYLHKASNSSSTINQMTTAPKYLISMEAFADGGEVKWVGIDSVNVGSADEATKLATARTFHITDSSATYNGANVSFDGTADITLHMPSTFAGTLKGNADSSTKTTWLQGPDTRNTNDAPSVYMPKFPRGLYLEFKGNSSINTAPGGTTYSSVVTYVPWGDNSGGRPVQMAINTGAISWRSATSDSAWGAWKTLIHSSNYTDYTVKKDGTGATGTWGISITGNAATATQAQSALKDGDLNEITTTYLKKSGGTMTGALNFANNTYNKFGDDVEIGDRNTSGKLYIHGINGATGIVFAPYSGSTSQTLSIDGAGVMTITGTLKATLSGNASTATTLQTARNFHITDSSATYNGPNASFNGSADVTLHMPNTFAGSLKGNADTATDADKLDGYHRKGLYTSPGAWINANEYTKTVTVEGDANTYYPVVISTTSEKEAINYISVWKNLGSKTAAYSSGNHSNGTSSMWLIYEARNWFWDGNGGYLKCWYRSMPYANLCAKAEAAGSGVGALVVYLRGGGTTYNISTTYAATVTVYLASTNIGSSSSPVNVAPTTSNGNLGKLSTVVLGYGNLDGNAGTATKWQTARNFQVDLALDNPATVAVDGTKDVILPVTGILATKHGGTGNSSHTANRLVWSETATKLSATNNHYASASQIAVNSTSAPTGYTFLVNGKTHLSGDARVTGNLLMTTGGSFIHWDNGTVQQRIITTDDSTADTAVFTFQQSENTASSWNNLLTIRDNGRIVLQNEKGGIYKLVTTANTSPLIQLVSDNQDVSIFKVASGTAIIDSWSCGFDLIYKGTGAGVNNVLTLYAGDYGNTATQVVGWSVNQAGQMGIRTTPNTSYSLNINGNTYSNGKFYINNTSDASLSADGAVVIGPTNGENLTLDTNEIMARNNKAASTLYLNNEGGLVQIGSGGLLVNGQTKTTGPLLIGSDANGRAKNYIAFYGTTSDGAGSFNHTYIGENLYGGTESSELVLFKGAEIGDAPENMRTTSGTGPDRIRHIAAGHLFQAFRTTSAKRNGTFADICAAADDVNLINVFEVNNKGVIVYGVGTDAQNYPAKITFKVKDTVTSQEYGAYIAAYNDHATTSYGSNFVINAGGNAFVGAGESAANLYALKTKDTGENMYITADGNVYLYAKADTVANRIGIVLDTSGNILPQKANSGNEQANPNTLNIGSNTNYFANMYTRWMYVNTGGVGTDGGISLWSNVSSGYFIAMRTTGSLGTHGYVTNDYATYFSMNTNSDSTTHRGWIFRETRIGLNVASIDTRGWAQFNGICLNRANDTGSNRTVGSSKIHHGFLSWYGYNWKNWVTYMSDATNNSCPTGGTPSTLGKVTTWALRSVIQNSSGYGWVWEASAITTTAEPDPTTKPTALMSLDSNFGQLRIAPKGTTNANTQTAGLVISSAENGGSADVAIELWRGANASWQMRNSGGVLTLASNYTSSAQSSYSQSGLTLDYNTGAGSIPYLAVGQVARNTSYRLYVNGTSYLGGNTIVKGHLTPDADSTYDVGSTSKHWRYGYYDGLFVSTQTGFTSTSGNAGVSGTFFGPGYAEMVASTPFIDFHQGDSTADYSARIISDGANRLTINQGGTPAAISYNSRSINPLLRVVGSLYSSSTIESAEYFLNNRSSSGGGFYVYGNNNQYARLYISTVGTAGDGTNAGTTGIAILTLGNGTAVAASGGANNARGLIRVYGANANYTDIYAQANGNRTLYLPNYAGNMYLVHTGSNSALGGAQQPVYIAANGRATACTSYTDALDGRYVNVTGDTMSSGSAQIQRAGSSTSWYLGRSNAFIRINSYSGYNAIYSMKTTDGDWSCGVYSNNILYWTYVTDTNFNAGSNTTTAQMYLTSAGYLYAPRVYNAVWNDYAEFRRAEIEEPGRVVIEETFGNMKMSTERLQPGGSVISDTYGHAMGETQMCKTPIAVAGRVLAYPLEDISEYQAGDAVCTGPNGTVSKMTREEIREYPDRIIGIVSEIPTYETWGQENIKVNGRIWIKVR